MNTNQLKRFATDARAKLRAGVASKIKSLGFDADGQLMPSAKPPVPMVGGCIWNEQILPLSFAKQWEALRTRIERKGLREVTEEAAYTWFNRLMAIRILTMNNITEPVLRFVDEARTPKIVDDARQGRIIDMPVEQRERLETLFKDATRINEQFALLLAEFCHHTPILQACFGGMDDYTEILLPSNILDKNGFVDMLNSADFISDEDYKSPELIGWLYQFYISDRKDEVFAKKGKVEADEIPAATQIFTPNWIVKYMVQNAVLPQVRFNRLPDEDKKYLVSDELPEEPKKPMDLKVADLACGSGHILNECFDILYDLYIASGYDRRDAIESIFAKNLLGIDIDERARQLSTFALILKACQKDETFADAHALPKVMCVPDISSDLLSPDGEVDPRGWLPHFFMGNVPGDINEEMYEAFQLLKDADSLGSIIKFNLSAESREILVKQVKKWYDGEYGGINPGIAIGLPAIEYILALTDYYDAIVMNPPYMGGGKMDIVLAKYVKDNYPDSKADLMTVFMEVAMRLTCDKGYWSMINLPSWMFLSSFEQLRIKLIDNFQIVSLCQNGRGVFGSDFGSVTFVIQNDTPFKNGYYRRLFVEHVQVRTNEKIHELYLNGFGQYNSNQVNFKKIPGNPIGYWLSSSMLSAFDKETVGSRMITREGMATADNDRFLRFWSEVSKKKFKPFFENSDKWYPYNKGGQFRKWYGNQDYVVDWRDNGYDIKNNIDPVTGRIRSHNYNGEFAFRECGTWSAISSGAFSIRYCPSGFLWDSKGACGFSDTNLNFIIGLLNSKVSSEFLSVLAPTVDYKVGDIIRVPLIISECSDVEALVINTIYISKADWDAHETSWNFQESPLVFSLKDNGWGTLEMSVGDYTMTWTNRFKRIHENEEEVNRKFIEIYGLQDELTPDVPLDEVTILQQGEMSIKDSELVWNHEVIIKQLISYIVGCYMGRYRLDKPGLAIAHPDPADEELAEYNFNITGDETFTIDSDAIIPLLPLNAPFYDNLYNYVSEFVKKVWGEETHTENMNYIERCLGKPLNDYLLKDFWKDHKKMYQNRPIYWLFSSEKGAFRAIVYVHRMHAYTVEQVRSRYLLKYMDWLRSEISKLEQREADLTTQERRSLDHLRSDLAECDEYHERLQVVAEQAISFDLDDGIVKNHALFGDILVKLK